MSNEDRGLSPADGPAPVWLDHVGRYESRFAAVQMLRSLIAVLSPLEVVQAMGEAKGGIAKVLIPRVYEQFQVGLRATDEALARAEKAENARDEATERAARYQRHWSAEVERAEQAERERDAMHAAAEELRAQGAELGENQFKYEGRVVEFSEPTLSGLTYHWTYWEAGETVKLDFANPGYRDAAFVELALAWWIKNAPADLCLTDDGRSVRTMATNEVRDVVTGRVLPLTRVYGANGELGARIPKGGGEDWLFFRDQVSFPETHPCSLPSNRLRVEAFLATSTRPSDSGQLSTDGATREDALVEEPGKQIRPVSDKSESAAVLPEAHSGRFLAQQLLSLAGQLTQVAVAFAELEGERGQS